MSSARKGVGGGAGGGAGGGGREMILGSYSETDSAKVEVEEEIVRLRWTQVDPSEPRHNQI